MKIDIIAGARPNFMKIAPIIEAIKVAQEKQQANLSFRLIHTGQHYDKKMSGDFFEQLGIPLPHINLEAGGGTQAEQTAAIMTRYEKALMEESSDLCLVVGDVNSTMACSIVAKKMNMKVAHVEAGIRSFDLTMPEEINRMVTDAITDYFYTTSATANNNLRKAGTPKEKIQFVGNTMIDTLYNNINKLKKPNFWDDYALKSGNYFVVTLHRPANVDNPEKLKEYIRILSENVRGLPVIFPIHPRTGKILSALNVVIPANFYIIDPLSYLEFIYLIKNAKAVITDSGGITEETTVLKVPCITLRDNTERPETVTKGTNELIGTNPQAIIPTLDKLFKGEWKKGKIPPLWDGKTGERIVAHLMQLANAI
jgi:UDP-N-acetylglucosamine 2-epimerase (non-hydrolysing)